MGFAEFLAETGAIRFGEFTLKSGRKSPYFINTGVIDDAGGLYELGSFYAERIAGLGLDFDIVFGPAYKGIPLAVATALALQKEHGMDKGWLFDRKEAKTHGDGGEFVGMLPKKGSRVVLVDDVMTTGGTKEEALAKISALGGKVVAVIIAVDREEKGGGGKLKASEEFTKKTGVPVHAVARISGIFERLRGGHVTEAVYKDFRAYIDRYG